MISTPIMLAICTKGSYSVLICVMLPYTRRAEKPEPLQFGFPSQDAEQLDSLARILKFCFSINVEEEAKTTSEIVFCCSHDVLTLPVPLSHLVAPAYKSRKLTAELL